ncbi:MAG: hypothetical protein ACOCQV_02110 [Halolamina sp.]
MTFSLLHDGRNISSLEDFNRAKNWYSSQQWQLFNSKFGMSYESKRDSDRHRKRRCAWRWRIRWWALYGSSSLSIERTDDGAEVRKDGELIDSLHHAVTIVEGDDAILGISMPERTTVQRVAVEIVWAIRRDAIWSDISVEP